MRLPALLVSDTHFVAEPACEYRFGLWPWLRKTAKEERVKTIVHLGDLVDRKDNHPAALVNRLADEVRKTRDETGAEQVYMAGNHDWQKEGEEFFRFLRHLDGVHYVAGPWEHPEVKGPLSFFLPYSKRPVTEWKDLDFSHYQLLFMHQTVGGSVSSNGERMSGEDLPRLNAGRVWSGDIHVPQVVEGAFGRVEYVGSPYHVHFGDDFRPRCVLLETATHSVDLPVPGMPRRVTVRASGLRQLAAREIGAGDQVKVRLELDAAERHNWAALRREATAWVRSRGAHVHGVELVATGEARRVRNLEAARIAGADPAEAVERFVRDEELGGDALDIALDLI